MPKITDVIKYEGDENAVVRKHPAEDFNSLTQLVVHETQEAVFFLNGEALDSFGPGRYTLETGNVPLIGRALKLATGRESPFHCEVWFVNKAEIAGIRWGVDSKIEYVEPTYGFPVALGASGEMTLRVTDARKLLFKLVGTDRELGREKLAGILRPLVVTRVKTSIAQAMKSGAVSVFEIDGHLTEFSDAIKATLSRDFAEYGVALERFYVTNIVKPDGERRYEHFKELHFRRYADVAEANLRRQVRVTDAETEAKKVGIEAEARAARRRQEGTTYKEERGFDVADKAAANEGIGQMTNLGVGLGTMAGVGGAVGGIVGGAVEGALGGSQPATGATDSGFCDNCGAQLAPGSSFCEECGTARTGTYGTCANCGYAFVRPGKFCPKCGNKR